ncbi:DNA translocase FtsK [uncultured Metabacillus sp.]|uniref:DNA translocase FtsK n=1 Tax=uncultured Metabacillus sp. TaxID=2860135 RepID=UPI002601AD33|nr:DNA translocase FtsK [uncultured Metabacillus sp.]
MNWLTKLVSFLTGEEDKEYENSQNQPQDDHIARNVMSTPSSPEGQTYRKHIAEARVAYQYPKGNFRFPIIPDEKRASIDDRPRSITRTTRTYEQKNHMNHKKESVNTQKQKQQTYKPRVKSQQTEEEKPKRPFSPSAIPSPVFGFQPREESMLYHRRLEKIQTEEMANSNTSEMNLSDTAAELTQKVQRVSVIRNNQIEIEKQEQQQASLLTNDHVAGSHSTEIAQMKVATNERQLDKEVNHLTSMLEDDRPIETAKNIAETKWTIEKQNTLEFSRNDQYAESIEDAEVVYSSPSNVWQQPLAYDLDEIQQPVTHHQEEQSIMAEKQFEVIGQVEQVNEMEQGLDFLEQEEEGEEVEHELDYHSQEEQHKVIDQEPDRFPQEGQLKEPELESSHIGHEEEQIEVEHELRQLSQVERNEIEQEPALPGQDDQEEKQEQELLYLVQEEEQKEVDQERSHVSQEEVQNEINQEPIAFGYEEQRIEPEQKLGQEERKVINQELDAQSQEELQKEQEQESVHLGQEEQRKESDLPQQEKRPTEVKQHVNKKANSGNKTLPFNVMMLGRDKQRMRARETSYQFPSLAYLNIPEKEVSEDHSWLNDQRELLDVTFKNFNVRASVVNVTQGPAVTRFEVHPEPGVKVNKITNLSDDIKLSLAAKDIRIEAPIPGKNTIGIEVPNKVSKMVYLREILRSSEFITNRSPMTAVLGLDISGQPVVTDLKKMPHGLIAGATGSGKSVCINTILVSLLYKAAPQEVKLMLIDPKMVELAPYNNIPHLVSPVITDVKAATAALKWAVEEMERRYELFARSGTREITRYNQLVKEYKQGEHLPYLVIVIDELADLMMVAPNDVEEAICRIAQKARACGIHLIVATQRPSVDVITGLIKANIPTRIAFSVSSQVDSRTIIDVSGAEKLLGKGDMLFLENGSSKAVRLQGTFVSDEEIERVVKHVKLQAKPNYLFHQDELVKKATIQTEEDELFLEACEFVVNQGGASTSLLQRRFRIGYNRAARLIDMMEEQGIISENRGSKPRDILISEEELETIHGE